VDDIKDVVDMLSLFYGVVYSDVVLMKVRYIFDRICLQRVHFCFLSALSCFCMDVLYCPTPTSVSVSRIARAL
jgi:hypothetical protein